MKAKTIANPSDVYEYHTERVRRSKVKMDLEKDEISGARAGGKDDEAEDDEGGRDQAELKPRLVGEDDDDEGIADDEDEDIDSDAAFDESDEEQFAGFGFSQKKVCIVVIFSIVEIHPRLISQILDPRAFPQVEAED